MCVHVADQEYSCTDVMLCNSCLHCSPLAFLSSASLMFCAARWPVRWANALISGLHTGSEKEKSDRERVKRSRMETCGGAKERLIDDKSRERMEKEHRIRTSERPVALSMHYSDAHMPMHCVSG